MMSQRTVEEWYEYYLLHTPPNIQTLIEYLQKHRPSAQPNGLLELNRRIEALNMVLLIKG